MGSGIRPNAPAGSRITVIGVGGCGCNAVNSLVASSLQGVTCIAASTNMQDLERSLAEHTIQLGTKIAWGLGTGANHRTGHESAVESIDRIKACLGETSLLFITAGMGGGTGTDAAPVIARAAREMGILTVGIVTRPFFFEGQRRLEAAAAGIEEMGKYADCLITLHNDRLVQLAPPRAGLTEMLKKGDEVLYYVVKGIHDLVIPLPGSVVVDFVEVRTVLGEQGVALVGTGVASGASRARDAALGAITSPLMEGASLAGARQVLLLVTHGPDFALDEVIEAVNVAQEAATDDVNVIFGLSLDSDMGQQVRATVIATGFDGGNAGSAGKQAPGHSPGKQNQNNRVYIFDEGKYDTPAYFRQQAE